MSDWFGASWTDIGWVAASTAAFYLTTFVAVRLAGRRTLAQLSAFDVLVTIALGSLLAGVVVSDDPSLANGVAALVTLLVLQVTVAWARQHTDRLQRLLDFPPLRVMDGDGVDLRSGPLTAQLTEEELWSMLRKKGVFDRSSVSVVILEPTGQISVLPAGEGGGDLLPSRR